MSDENWVSDLQEHYPDELVLFVISDLHVHHDETAARGESNYARDMSDHTESNNPYIALTELVRKRELKADFIICPGDITDKAHPGALGHGWRILHDLRRQTDARAVLATPGNHDVDSRFEHSQYDARGAVLSLEPDFPLDDRGLSNNFWARNYCMINGGNYRMLLLNSAAYHGEGLSFAGDLADQPRPIPEYEHGRISPHTLNAIENELRSSSPKATNILVCHHHPDRVAAMPFDAEYSAMEGGRELVDMLSKPEYGRWIIIHGHRHLGAIHQPASSNTPGPIAFCAASFGKTLPREWPSGNQVYELHISTSPSTFGLRVAARFTSFEWARGGEGFHVATQDARLPGLGGLGYVGEPALIASKIHSFLGPHPSELTLSELSKQVSELNFLQPDAWASLRHELRQLSIKIFVDPDDGELSFKRAKA